MSHIQHKNRIQSSLFTLKIFFNTRDIASEYISVESHKFDFFQRPILQLNNLRFCDRNNYCFIIIHLREFQFSKIITSMLTLYELKKVISNENLDTLNQFINNVIFLFRSVIREILIFKILNSEKSIVLHTFYCRSSTEL